MPFARGDLPVIIELLDEMATSREVNDLFRQKGAPFSAPNWATFVEQRVPPAIESGRVTVDDLATLLGQAEEHGRQHMFLYKTARQAAGECLAEARIRRGLQRLGVPAILDSPRVLDKPDEATFTEARIERTPKGQPKALVIKQVLKRESREVLGERRTSPNRIQIDVSVEEVRAINLVKLNADGLIEVRIQSHTNPQYAREASQLLLALHDLLPDPSAYGKFMLTTAKNNLFAQRRERSGDVRYTSSTLKNDRGSTIEASASTDVGDLFADDGMASTVDEFMDHDAYCDSSNLWFRVGTKPNGEPNWIHALVAGQDNEFTLTAHCSMREYEQVLGTLRQYVR